MELHPLIRMASEAFPYFVIIDNKCDIFFINQSYCELLGIEQANAIGHPVSEVIPGTLLPEIVRTGRRDIGSLMTLFDHSQKKPVTVVCNRIPLIENGVTMGAVAMTTFRELSNVEQLVTELNEIKAENARIKEEIETLKRTDNPLEKIIGNSSPIMDIKKTIADFAQSNLAVLLTGETGVGKEVFASAIHELSNRKTAPFIKVNCAAIPKDLLESELFGYEPGAFTGAKKQGKPGKFELADGGTLLLDEIGEMPMPLQSKLLRVLQEKEVERVGGNKPQKIDVRIICSTNQNILDQIDKGDFRSDLYYRVNTIEIQIPPLRDRKSDIPALCNFFIGKNNLASGFNTVGIDPSVVSLFMEYNWPGNVRELEHVMERLCYLNPNDVITLNHCDFFIKKISKASTSSKDDNPVPKSQTIEVGKSLTYNRDQAEISSIVDALNQAGGNKAKAARILGIDRTSLYYKLKKYKLYQ